MSYKHKLWKLKNDLDMATHMIPSSPNWDQKEKRIVEAYFQLQNRKLEIHP